jgi:O-methyltransferase
MPEQNHRAPELYLDLLKKSLTRYLFPERYQLVQGRRGSLRGRTIDLAQRLLAARGLALTKQQRFDPAVRAEGRDWPAEAETMIGLRRLDNLQDCIADVLYGGVPGDLMEAGVWRGGAAIFMRAMLEAHGDTQRVVWAADSFQGLPQPDPKRYPRDKGDRHWTHPELAVSLETVKGNFARYGLLDERVRFLAGWFKDTLPHAPIRALAVLRVDADMYESTMHALSHLYPKLSVGGYVIVDDYGAVPGCRAAVEDFRTAQGISESLQPIDNEAVYWQRKR